MSTEDYIVLGNEVGEEQRLEMTQRQIRDPTGMQIDALKGSLDAGMSSFSDASSVLNMGGMAAERAPSLVA